MKLDIFLKSTDFIKNHLENLLLTGSCSDITIILEDDYEIKAHRIILSLAFLRYNLEDIDSIKISGISKISFKHFLYFIYTGRMADCSIRSALAIEQLMKQIGCWEIFLENSNNLKISEEDDEPIYNDIKIKLYESTKNVYKQGSTFKLEQDQEVKQQYIESNIAYVDQENNYFNSTAEDNKEIDLKLFDESIEDNNEHGKSASEYSENISIIHNNSNNVVDKVVSDLLKNNQENMTHTYRIIDDSFDSDFYNDESRTRDHEIKTNDDFVEFKGKIVDLKTITYKCPLCKNCHGHRKSFYGHFKYMHPKANIAEYKQNILKIPRKEDYYPERIDHEWAVIAGPKPENIYENAFKCPKCERPPFSTFKELEVHTNKKHQGQGKAEIDSMERKPYKCEKCGTCFGYNSHLARHVFEQHSGKSIFPCDECGKTFKTKHNCIAHKNIVHLNKKEKPHFCDECGKSFVRNIDLKSHKLMHKGERPIECNQCGARFTSTKVLRSHCQFKHSEKKWKCDNCEKVFPIEIRLINHVEIVHLGVKKYSCDFCDYLASCKGNKNKHIQNCKKRKQNNATDRDVPS